MSTDDRTDICADSDELDELYQETFRLQDEVTLLRSALSGLVTLLAASVLPVAL